jgi:hypothetical protein
MFMECRHILPGGDKCCAPAIRTRAYCYFHLLNRRTPPPSLNASRKTRRASTIDSASTQTLDLGCPVPDAAEAPSQIQHSIPLLEDRMAVQIALTNVLEAIATNRIDPQRAGLLLYGLQIASSNAKDFIGQTSSSVRSYTVADNGDMLGPIENGIDFSDTEQLKEQIKEQLKPKVA